MRAAAVLLVGAVLAAGATAARTSAGDDPVPVTLPEAVAPTGTGDVEGLSAPLRRAIARAVTAAAEDGVELRVTSGWRSPDHQQRLYDDAIRKYGSRDTARRWVLPPGESEHVQGRAVDVGPPEAARWLDREGVRFGLCRRYDNEPWHFERLAAAVGSSCPPREPHA